MSEMEVARPKDQFPIHREKTTTLRAFPIEAAEKAIEAFEDETLDLPPVPDAPVVLTSLLRNALLLIDNGDYRNAKEILGNILYRSPHNTDAIEWFGYCLNKLGDHINAAKCFRELVRLEPDEYSYSLLAETLYNLGQFAEAEAYYKKALGEIHYESPLLYQIHKNLGNIAISTGDIDDAEENYNKAYNLCPHSDALLVNYGTLELQKGNLEAAHERFKEAIQTNAQNDKAWVGLALIHRQKGDFDLARANVERALDISGDNKTALQLFVQWSFVDFSTDRAVERLQTYLASSPDDGEVSTWLAEAYFRLGKIDEALFEVERAAAIDGETAVISGMRKIIETEKQRKHDRVD